MIKHARTITRIGTLAILLALLLATAPPAQAGIGWINRSAPLLDEPAFEVAPFSPWKLALLTKFLTPIR